VVPQPFNEYFTPTTEAAFDVAGWYPPVPFALRPGLSGEETLVAAMGQYNGAGGTERVYDQMAFEVLYSDSYDWWEPIVLVVNGAREGRKGYIKVEAVDGSGIHKVVAVYTDGTGTHHSHDLTYDAEIVKWTGEVPAAEATTFYVQVVDTAGNVAVENNKGQGYEFETVEGGEGARVYLPLILRN
jgi:hypothetical protein